MKFGTSSASSESVAIISDLHDNLANLKKCLDWCRKNKIAEMLCVGDVTNRGTLKFLAENFFGRIHLIRGNMEIYDESEVNKYSNLDYLGRFGVAEVMGKKVGLCHEPVYIKKVMASEIIFYGHTHKPWIEKRQGIPVINPGTLGGVFQRPTFAVWKPRTRELELKLLETI